MPESLVQSGRRRASLVGRYGERRPGGRAKVGSVTDELPAVTVADGAAWRAWLQEHHGDDRGVWLTLAKKGGAAPTRLTYDEALEEALCHGWIDGQIRGGGKHSYRQRFTPRTPRSGWSKRNVAIAERLIAEGRMQVRDSPRWSAPRPTAVGTRPTPDRRASRCRPISPQPWTPSPRRGRCSRTSTAGIATPSSTASRRRSVPRPGADASSSSSPCSRGEKPSTPTPRRGRQDVAPGVLRGVAEQVARLVDGVEGLVAPHRPPQLHPVVEALAHLVRRRRDGHVGVRDVEDLVAQPSVSRQRCTICPRSRVSMYAKTFRRRSAGSDRNGGNISAYSCGSITLLIRSP